MADTYQSLYKVILEFEGKGGDALWDDLKKSMKASRIDSALVQNIRKASSGMASDITKMYAKAVTGGFNKAEVGKIEQLFSNANMQMQQAAKAVLDAQRKVASLSADASEEEIRAAREQVKFALEEAAIKEKAVRSEIDASRKMIEERHKAIQAAEEFQNKGLMDRVKTIKGMFSETYQKAKGGDISGVMEMFGKGKELQTGITALGARGAAGAAAGAGGTAAAGGAAAGGGAAAAGGGAAAAGSLAAALGPLAVAAAAVAAAFAVVAGAVYAVVKVVMEAVAQAKEMNRAIYDMSAGLDTLATDAPDDAEAVRKGLQDMREAATDFVNNVKWDTTHEEIMKILGAANEAGLTFREMRGEFTKMSDAASAYVEVTDVALRFSKLLGVEADKLAETMAEWADDFGMGLKQVEESFAVIGDLAMESGFGVKRFYSMVQQATTGVGLYNVRIEEAAKLLSETGKILGEQEAADFIKEMTKGFASESYEDNLKRIMITGTDRMREIMSKDLKKTADSFADKFGESAQSFVSDKLGIDISGDQGGQALADKLGAMSEGERKKFIAQLGRKDAKAARELEHVVDLAAAVGGDMSDIAMAMDNLSIAGTVETSLAGIEEFFGKGLSDLSVVQMMAAEQVTGMSKEQLEAMRLIEQRLSGQMAILKDNSAEAALLAEEMGLQREVDEKGNVILKDEFGNQITKASELSRHQVEKMDDVTKVISRQEALAASMVEHTRDFGNVLKNGAVYFLERIYGILSDFYAAWTGLSDSERASKKEAVDQQQKAYQATVEEQANVASQIEELKRDIATGRKLGSESEGEMAELLKKQEALGTQAEAIKATIAEIESAGKTWGDVAQEIGSLGMYEVGGSTNMGGILLEQLGLKEVKGAETWTQRGAASVAGDPRRLSEGLRGDIAAGGAAGRADMEGKARAVGQFQKGAGLLGSIMTGNPMVAAAAKAGEELNVSMAGWFGEQQGATEAVAEKLEEGQKMADKKAQEAQKKQDEQTKATEEVSETMESIERRKAAAKILDVLGSQVSERDMQALLGGGAGAAQTASKLGAGLSDEQRAAMDGALSFFKTGAMNDFVYRGGARGGTITPINKADQLLGGKAGGPLADALGGGGNNVTININGGDTAKIYDTVKRAMRGSKGGTGVGSRR